MCGFATFSWYFWAAPSPFSYGIWQHTSIQLMQFLPSQEPEVSSWLKWFKDTFLKAKTLNIHLKCISVRKKKKVFIIQQKWNKSYVTLYLTWQNFLNSTEERTYSYLGKIRLILQTFFEFPGLDTWQSGCVRKGEMKLILHNWELSLWCCALSGLHSYFVFFCLFFSPEVSPHLCVSITYLYSCLILYSPSGLSVPDKLWDCDGYYQNLFTFKETEAKEIKFFVQVLYGVRSTAWRTILTQWVSWGRSQLR